MKKFSSFVKATIAVLCAFVLSFGLFANNALATGDFSLSCFDSSVDGSTLVSQCRRINGSIQPTSINLNPFIENVNGDLLWQPDNFIATCFDTELEGGFLLTGKCKRRDQSINYTEIDLDEHIANIDGTLTFEF